MTPDHEFMIVACDGIWDVMSNQEVIDFCRDRFAAGREPEAVSGGRKGGVVKRGCFDEHTLTSVLVAGVRRSADALFSARLPDGRTRL